MVALSRFGLAPPALPRGERGSTLAAAPWVAARRRLPPGSGSVTIAGPMTSPLTEPPPFVAYGAAHTLALGAIAGATVILVVLLRATARRPWHGALRRTAAWGLVVILLAGAAEGQWERVAAGQWSLQESLPLHLCDIGVFVTVVALIGAAGGRVGRGVYQRCYELAYVWALGGTSQAVLTPDVAHSFPDPVCVRYFFLHGAVLVAVLMMTLALGWRPLPGAVRRVWVVTLGLAVVVLLVNWALGANYMYLCRPPARPSLFDYFGAWPWSLLSLAAVGTVLIGLCCLPFWLMDRWHTRTNAQ